MAVISNNMVSTTLLVCPGLGSPLVEALVHKTRIIVNTIHTVSPDVAPYLQDRQARAINYAQNTK